jgi:hypothetical protein
VGARFPGVICEKRKTGNYMFIPCLTHTDMASRKQITRIEVNMNIADVL